MAWEIVKTRSFNDGCLGVTRQKGKENMMDEQGHERKKQFVFFSSLMWMPLTLKMHKSAPQCNHYQCSLYIYTHGSAFISCCFFLSLFYLSRWFYCIRARYKNAIADNERLSELLITLTTIFIKRTKPKKKIDKRIQAILCSGCLTKMCINSVTIFRRDVVVSKTII